MFNTLLNWIEPYIGYYLYEQFVDYGLSFNLFDLTLWSFKGEIKGILAFCIYGYVYE